MAINHGWEGISTISTIRLSGEIPERDVYKRQVIDHRDCEPVFYQIEGFNNGRQKLGGGDQVDIVGALILKTEKKIGKLADGNLFSEAFLADLIILAETAAQRTAGEKDGAAAIGAADTWLFPHMKGGSCYFDGGAAFTVSGGLGAVYAAFSGA